MYTPTVSSRLNRTGGLRAAALWIMMATAAAACPIGISGRAKPNATVCAQDQGSGLTWCTTADGAGNFNITGAGSGSSGTGCLPTGGQFWIYDTNCPWDGMYVDRNITTQQYGGAWLDVRCGQLVHWGVVNSPLGNVDLTVSPATGNLMLDNIGSSGQDGVEIASPNTEFLSTDVLGLAAAPIGTTLTLAADGTLDGFTPHAAGTLVLARGAAGWTMTPDLSPIGSPTIQYQVYRNRRLVGVLRPSGPAQTLGMSDAPARLSVGADPDPLLADGDCGCGFIGNPKNKVGRPALWKFLPNGPYVYACPRPAGNPPPVLVGCSPWWWWQINFDSPTTVSLTSEPNEPLLIGDTVQLVMFGPSTLQQPVSAVSLTASGVPALTIARESVGMFALPHVGLGQAVLATDFGPLGRRLLATSIGGSLDDGIRIDVRRSGGVGVQCDGIEGATPLPDGASLHARARGIRGGQPDQPLGRLAVTKSVGQFVVFPDFAEVGSATFGLALRSGGLTVGEWAGQTAPSVASAWPMGVVVESEGNSPDGVAILVATFPPATAFNIGGGAYVGDELRLWAESGGACEAISSLSLHTLAIPQLALLDAFAAPAACPGDADGDRDVDQDDLDLVLFDFDQAVPPGTLGDVNGDGAVNQDDLDLVLFNFEARCV